MRELDPPEISGYTVFCDDIRFEQEGKITLVGIYHSAILIRSNEFPVNLPKFALSVVFNQLKSIFEPKLQLRISLPGDKVEEPSIVVEIEPPADLPALNSERPTISARANIILAPLTINGPGQIKVRIERRGDLHPVGRLDVQVVDPAPSPGAPVQPF